MSPLDHWTAQLIHEPQQGPRDCGVAALVMVYHAFGIACTQEDLRPLVTRAGRGGVPCAHTHLLVGDALRRGLEAIIVQTRSPWEILKVCYRLGVHAILNHRLPSNPSAGHYSVLVSCEDQVVVLHDPLAGPNRRLAWTEFAALWRPGPGAEIAGNVLVALARDSSASSCSICGNTIPPIVGCPVCRYDIPMKPMAVLGCADASCPGRLWESLFCPRCDTRIVSTNPGRLSVWGMIGGW